MINSILVILGTIIGAGFASGKELYTFFIIHGVYGLFGLAISVLIIGLIIYTSLKIIITNNINSYSQFINTISPRLYFIDAVFCNIINIFLLITFIVMVSGFSAFFAQQYNMPHIFGALIISILSFFTLMKNITGIIKINKFFIPCLIFLIMLIGIKNINNYNPFRFNYSYSKLNWIISSVLYASYNLIVIFPLLISLKNQIKTPCTSKMVAIIVSSILLLISLILFYLLNLYFVYIKNLDLPTIYISSQYGLIYKYSFSIVILGAIFTTAISSGYGLLYNLNISNKKVFVLVNILMCLLAILLCNIGFSKLLNLLYPILGIIRTYTNSFYTNFL